MYFNGVSAVGSNICFVSGCAGSKLVVLLVSVNNGITGQVNLNKKI